MTDDILKEASRALQATTEGADESARFTRARVLTSLHQKRRRRATKAVMIVPLAAILLGGSAWAATTGKLPAVVYRFAEVVGIASPAPEGDEPRRGGGGTGRAAPGAVNPTAVDPADIEASSEPEPEPEAVEIPDEPEPEPAKPAPRLLASAQASPVVKASPSTDAESAKAYELYRKAHHLHFEQHNAAAALSAWNEYLREAPGGRFALEANYNRGICLVRLGRAAEARRVLEPFADGLYGGYRQAEATELIRALRGDKADAGVE